MTLKEAQKQWDDAIEMKISHKPNSVTKEQLIKWAGQSWDNPIKPLFIKIGKTSSRIIYSKLAAKEDLRQKSMIPGTKVKMTGAEASFEEYKEKVWTVTHGPQLMCGEWVVWLEGYSGAYSCEFLKVVTIN